MAFNLGDPAPGVPFSIRLELCITPSPSRKSSDYYTQFKAQATEHRRLSWKAFLTKSRITWTTSSLYSSMEIPANVSCALHRRERIVAKRFKYLRIS